LEAKLSTIGNAPLQDYWLKVFKNCEVLAEEVKPDDEPILKHLTKVEFSSGKEESKET